MDVLTYFFQCDRFLRNSNAIFIMLIPKKSGAMDIKDFLPISLVSGMYKIIVKIMANELKEVLGKVVSKFQNVFFQMVLDFRFHTYSK